MLNLTKVISGVIRLIELLATRRRMKRFLCQRSASEAKRVVIADDLKEAQSPPKSPGQGVSS